MRDTDVAYVAGLFDADGHVAVYIGSGPNRNALVYKAEISQSSEDNDPPSVLLYVQGLFRGSVRERANHNNRLSRKPQYEWNTTSKNAREFLNTIYPHTQVKKAHIKFVLDLWEIRFDRAALEVGVAERKRLFGRRVYE